MAMPGFTAEHSLQPALVNYTHGSVHHAGSGRGYVSPQFLDFIKEAFEKIVEGLSAAARATAEGVKTAFEKLNDLAKRQGQSFACGNWVMTMLKCNGNSPAMAMAQMTSDCVRSSGGNPALAAACAAMGAAVYGLAVEYCKSPGQSTAPFIQAACPN